MVGNLKSGRAGCILTDEGALVPGCVDASLDIEMTFPRRTGQIAKKKGAVTPEMLASKLDVAAATGWWWEPVWGRELRPVKASVTAHFYVQLCGAFSCKGVFG